MSVIRTDVTNVSFLRDRNHSWNSKDYLTDSNQSIKNGLIDRVKNAWKLHSDFESYLFFLSRRDYNTENARDTFSITALI